MEQSTNNNSSDTASGNSIPVSQPPSSLHPKTNVLLPVVLTLLVSAAIFGSGGYYVGKQSSNQPEIASSVRSSPTTTASPDTQTYTDEKYQFSFQYPQDWKLNCTKPQVTNWLDRNICDITAPNTSLDHELLLSGAYFVIGVSKPNSNYSNFQEYIEYSVDQYGYEATTKTVNNIQGYELVSPTNSVFVFERKGHFISLSGIPQETTNPYFANIQKILSSFILNNE